MKKYITFPASATNGGRTTILRSSIIGFSEPDPHRIVWTNILLDSGQYFPLNGLDLGTTQRIVDEFDLENKV